MAPIYPTDATPAPWNPALETVVHRRPPDAPFVDDIIIGNTGYDRGRSRVLLAIVEVRHIARDHFDIVQWILQGRVGHIGTLGPSSFARAGQIQLISSGDGLLHATINPDNRTAEFLELWLPAADGHGPYFRAIGRFPGKQESGQWVLIASGNLEDQALLLRAPSRIWGARIEAGTQLDANFDPHSPYYMVSGSGRCVIGEDYGLGPGDSLALQGERQATIRAIDTTEILLVETL